jgi:hypothetical protein
MPTKKKAQRPAMPRLVVAVVQPVTRRLSRIEDLLIEVRGVLDMHLKRISVLQKQLNELKETVEDRRSRETRAS